MRIGRVESHCRNAEIAEDGPNLAMMGGEQGAKRQKVSSEEVREFLAGAAPTLQPALAHCGGGEAEEEGRQWAAPIGDVAQLAV